MVAEKLTPDGEVLREGFAVCADYPHGADYEWVCPECFGLFKQEMDWVEA